LIKAESRCQKIVLKRKRWKRNRKKKPSNTNHLKNLEKRPACRKADGTPSKNARIMAR